MTFKFGFIIIPLIFFFNTIRRFFPYFPLFYWRTAFFSCSERKSAKFRTAKILFYPSALHLPPRGISVLQQT